MNATATTQPVTGPTAAERRAANDRGLDLLKRSGEAFDRGQYVEAARLARLARAAFAEAAR